MSLNPNSTALPMSNKPVSSEDLSFASSAAAAVLHQSPRGGQQLLWMIMAFVVGIIVWAAYAEIDEFTRGQGRVIPSRSVQLIQNLEGGIVAEVFVREGQLVKRGEPVIRLDSIGFSSSLSETKVNQAQLLAKATRLNAEAEGSDFLVAQLLTSLSKTAVEADKNIYTACQQ